VTLDVSRGNGLKMQKKTETRQFIKIIEKWGGDKGWLGKTLAIIPFSILFTMQIFFWKLFPLTLLPLYRHILNGMNAAFAGKDENVSIYCERFGSIKQLARKNIQEFLWVLSYLTTCLIKHPRDIIIYEQQTISVPSMASLKKAHAAGRPIILVCPHLSSSFLIPFCFALNGYRVTMVEDMTRSDDVRQAIGKIFEQIRQLFPSIEEARKFYKRYNQQSYENIKDLDEFTFDLELLRAQDASHEALGKRLLDGRIIILLNDYRHRIKETGELTDQLFGIKACVSRGAAALIARYQAASFSCAVSRQGKQLQFSLSDALLYDPEAGIDEIALKLFRQTRHHIYTSPEQWMLWPKVTSHIAPKERAEEDEASKVLPAPIE
jgi:lauroyl/myristoyl acyltransferase